MSYPKTFQDLIDSFKSLPGVGYKTAERYAYSIIEKSPEQVEIFSIPSVDKIDNTVEEIYNFSNKVLSLW